MIRKISSAFFKARIRLTQKRYKRLKYLFQRGVSNTLVVSFSGFPGDGVARYNYINTLQPLDDHKLFILDDFGYKKRGSYYLGENGDWFVPAMVLELIERVQEENNINRLIMIGSSKGGTAALYYAIKAEASLCVIGAPQYHCGEYLSAERHLPILEGIMGNTNQESIQKLNDVVRNCIESASKMKPKVYIHYSPFEHTYAEHIADLISDLKQNAYSVIEDSDYEYTEHGDVAKHFPIYMLQVLREKEKIM